MLDIDQRFDRFQNTSTAKNYEEYTQLLKDATFLVENNCIQQTQVIRMIIARSPIAIKSFLFQLVGSSSDFQCFIKKAEDASWIPFPSEREGNICRTEGGKPETSNHPDSSTILHINSNITTDMDHEQIIVATKKITTRRTKENPRKGTIQ